MKKTICFILKILITICVVLGVLIACLTYKNDGYSAWYKRLYYFTNISNLFMGIISVVCLIIPFTKHARNENLMNRVYLIRYVLVVGIAVTCLIFCGLLAPFADEDYNTWSFNSVLLHVVVPVLSIIDFSLDKFPASLNNKCVWWGVVFPLVYFIIAFVMGSCGVDFGRGDCFPYFFMDVNNPAGFFGFKYAKPRPYIGMFYWLIILCLIILLLSKLIITISPCLKKEDANK